MCRRRRGDYRDLRLLCLNGHAGDEAPGGWSISLEYKTHPLEKRQIRRNSLLARDKDRDDFSDVLLTTRNNKAWSPHRNLHFNIALEVQELCRSKVLTGAEVEGSGVGDLFFNLTPLKVILQLKYCKAHKETIPRESQLNEASGTQGTAVASP